MNIPGPTSLKIPIPTKNLNIRARQLSYPSLEAFPWVHSPTNAGSASILEESSSIRTTPPSADSGTAASNSFMSTANLSAIDC